MLLLRRRRQAASTEQVEESGYMASASDLMIGILFIFIVMVMVLLARKPEPPAEPPPDPLATVVQAIGAQLQQDGVPVTINQASGVITLPADTLFTRGSAELDTDGVRTLQTAAARLRQVLPCYVFSQRRQAGADCPLNPEQVEIETILIEGHTDSTPLRRGDYTNWHLGLDRARAVYKLLGSGGLQSLRNERAQPIFGISSYADERPAQSGDADNAALNRRVELRFILAFRPDEGEAGAASALKRLQGSVR